MRPVTLKQIEAFVSVADLGSFRRAAQRLHTTQPNISARIAGLETALGVLLMERDAGSVHLTPRGQTLLIHARTILRSVEDLVGAVGDAGLVEGVLRLGVTELVVQTWLATFLSALKDRLPNVLVELTVDLSSSLSRALLDRTLDLTFQNGPFSRAIAGTVPLGDYPFVWVAGAALKLDARRTMEKTDILAHPILTHARGTQPYDQLAAHLADAGSIRPRLVPSSNLAACMQMAMDGYGLACLPRAQVRTPLAQGRLLQLDYRWTPDPLSFAARFDPTRCPDFVAQAARLACAIAADDQNS
ncbi:LysR family transcriptional regulator [Sulfitobacter sp. LCG007]